MIVRLGEVFINNRELYYPILAFDAELVLQVGERVLDTAERRFGWRRNQRPENTGDVTIDIRLSLNERLHLQASGSDVEIGNQ